MTPSTSIDKCLLILHSWDDMATGVESRADQQSIDSNFFRASNYYHINGKSEASSDSYNTSSRSRSIRVRSCLAMKMHVQQPIRLWHAVKPIVTSFSNELLSYLSSKFRWRLYRCLALSGLYKIDSIICNPFLVPFQ